MTIYKNGVAQDGSGGTVDTRVTASAGDQNKIGSFTLPVVAGDEIYVECDRVNSAPVCRTVLLAFQATNPADFNLGANTNGSGNTSTTPNYFFPQAPGNTGTSATEANQVAYGGDTPFTITGLTVWCAVAPGVGKSLVFTLRKNGADTAIVATISGANTTASASGSVTITQGDSFCIEQHATGTPLSTIRPLRWAFYAAGPSAGGRGGGWRWGPTPHAPGIWTLQKGHYLGTGD